MYIYIQLYLHMYIGIRLLKPYDLSPGPQLVEVPGNADFTKGQFWPVCPCVTNVMLTTPAKEKATFANRSDEYRSP